MVDTRDRRKKGLLGCGRAAGDLQPHETLVSEECEAQGEEEMGCSDLWYSAAVSLGMACPAAHRHSLTGRTSLPCYTHSIKAHWGAKSARPNTKHQWCFIIFSSHMAFSAWKMAQSAARCCTPQTRPTEPQTSETNDPSLLCSSWALLTRPCFAVGKWPVEKDDTQLWIRNFLLGHKLKEVNCRRSYSCDYFTLKSMDYLEGCYDNILTVSMFLIWLHMWLTLTFINLWACFVWNQIRLGLSFSLET